MDRTTEQKNSLPPVSRGYLRIKRVQDFLLSAFALLALLPFLVLIALIIFIDDPHGAPIFVQTRCGKNGTPFRFYKFRTMCVDAEQQLEPLLPSNEMDGPAFKIKNDPRITRFGRFLRKTGLDELPQLWNVLLGDMSLVGPRPALPRELARYTDTQRLRTLVTPGLTCFWQIQPNRNALSFDTWMEFDLRYLRERSFGVDWMIMLKTLRVIVTCQGE